MHISIRFPHLVVFVAIATALFYAEAISTVAAYADKREAVVPETRVCGEVLGIGEGDDFLDLTLFDESSRGKWSITRIKVVKDEYSGAIRPGEEYSFFFQEEKLTAIAKGNICTPDMSVPNGRIARSALSFVQVYKRSQRPDWDIISAGQL